MHSQNYIFSLYIYILTTILYSHNYICISILTTISIFSQRHSHSHNYIHILTTILCSHNYIYILTAIFIFSQLYLYSHSYIYILTTIFIFSQRHSHSHNYIHILTTILCSHNYIYILTTIFTFSQLYYVLTIIFTFSQLYLHSHNYIMFWQLYYVLTTILCSHNYIYILTVTVTGICHNPHTDCNLLSCYHGYHHECVNYRCRCMPSKYSTVTCDKIQRTEQLHMITYNE